MALAGVPTVGSVADVAILGGGLAGQTLALQLKQRRPELDVVVIEKADFPVPESTHKVGESTVEIGAHYLSERLGLMRHFSEQQLNKFGLRLFFGGQRPSRNLAEYDELGASDYLPIPSYQVDRGRLENHLLDANRELDVRFETGTRIRGVELGEAGPHRVMLSGNAHDELRARWVVDASGRQRVLSKQLQLGENVDHPNAAVWMRVSSSLDVDEWGEGGNWLERCGGRARRLSTNHFMGRGYWVWVIPLASGATSIGLVFDPKRYPFTSVNSEGRLKRWLREFQPLVAERLDASQHEVMDFMGLRHYAHSAKQVFSADRWAITGDAGVFSDPFYSPGNDFIALSNTLISDLICSDENARTLQRKTRFFQQMYGSFFDSTLSLYQGQYDGFGNADFMAVKTIWDYAYYWGVLAKLFYSGAMTHVATLAASTPALQQTLIWNREVQGRLVGLSSRMGESQPSGRFFDHHSVDLFHRLKHSLIADDASISESNAGSSLDIDLVNLGQVKDRVLESLAGFESRASAPSVAWLGDGRQTNLATS